MSSNKSARENLERIYGKKCMMHEGLKIKIKGYSKKKITLKGKALRQQLTYHHLVPKSEGGPATEENGALLCAECHAFLESLRREKREAINRELRQYKMNFIATNGVEVSGSGTVEFLSLDEEDFLSIPLEENNQRYNRAKAKREAKRKIMEQEEEMEL